MLIALYFFVGAALAIKPTWKLAHAVCDECGGHALAWNHGDKKVSVAKVALAFLLSVVFWPVVLFSIPYDYFRNRK